MNRGVLNLIQSFTTAVQWPLFFQVTRIGFQCLMKQTHGAWWAQTRYRSHKHHQPVSNSWLWITNYHQVNETVFIYLTSSHAHALVMCSAPARHKLLSFNLHVYVCFLAIQYMLLTQKHCMTITAKPEKTEEETTQVVRLHTSAMQSLTDSLLVSQG